MSAGQWYCVGIVQGWQAHAEVLLLLWETDATLRPWHSLGVKPMGATVAYALLQSHLFGGAALNHSQVQHGGSVGRIAQSGQH
jgi:hypothetical protein